MSRLMNQDTITWVMCSSMLPEEDGLYLVTYNNFGSIHAINGEIVADAITGVWAVIYDSNKRKWISSFCKSIIAWAKLPEPFTGV